MIPADEYVDVAVTTETPERTKKDGTVVPARVVTKIVRCRVIGGNDTSGYCVYDISRKASRSENFFAYRHQITRDNENPLFAG